jgi:hypothetical protein
METNATEANIVKYLSTLKDLHLILKNTSRLSMLKFSETHKVSKNLSTVLQDGGVIKSIKKGKGSEWEWISIEPNRYMAVKVLQELGKRNPERLAKKKELNTLKRPAKKRELNTLERYTEALKEMKTILDNTPKIGMTKFCKKHRINTNLSLALQNLKVVEKIMGGSNPQWKWTGEEPSIDMAYDVYNCLTELHKEYVTSAKPKSVKPKETSKELSHYESKVLFGLVTLKLKPVFK